MMKDKICPVDGCGNFQIAKGLCKTHHARLMKGLPLVARSKARKGEPLAFLQSLVGTDDKECILWPYAGKNIGKGYGRIKHEGVQMNASRLVCIFAHGEPEDDSLQAAHSCGKGHLGCVNPNHVSWKTPSDNGMDRHQHGTAYIGASNHNTKLNEDQARYIKQELLAGTKSADLARLFGVNRGTIACIKNGRSWGYVQVARNETTEKLCGIEP